MYMYMGGAKALTVAVESPRLIYAYLPKNNLKSISMDVKLWSVLDDEKNVERTEPLFDLPTHGTISV